MNTFVVAFLAALAVANAGLIAPSAHILQGPSSRTTLVGPEGSVISSVAPGGQIITEHNPGYVAHSAPALSYAAPIVQSYAAPAYHGLGNTIVAGPSGTIATSAGLPLAHSAGLIVPAGHGLEGQYVHDYSETLYDDGSYKPHFY